MNKRIACIATSFGYGSVAKLLSIVTELSAIGYDMVFIGSGSSLEMARGYSFSEIVVADTSQDKLSDDVLRQLSSTIAVVNVLEPSIGGIANYLGLPHFYVDSLFWMWPAIDTRVANSEIYFIQDFPGVRSNLDRWSETIKTPLIVGPIINLYGFAKCTKKENLAVINYGGIETWMVSSQEALIYPQIMTELILESLSRSPKKYDKIVFAGNRSIMEQLDNQFKKCSHNTQFCYLRHQEYIEMIRDATCIITSPGLTATFEAFSLGLDVKFLPPQNYSQTLMLDYYRDTGLTDISLHWTDIYDNYKVKLGMEEEIAVRQVRNTINTFSQDYVAHQRAIPILSQIFNSPMEERTTKNQACFVESFGSTSSVVIASKIDNALHGLTFRIPEIA